MKIVVFDVDNTLVKGHLITIYVKALLFKNPLLLGYFFRLAGVGISLLFWRIPRLLKSALRSGDLTTLDRGLQRYAAVVIKKLYTIFDELGFTGPTLAAHVKELVFRPGFERFLHHKALRMLELHLRRSDGVVVLASGAMEEFIHPFHEWLCAYLATRGIVTRKRLLVVATQRDAQTGMVRVCIGEQKMKRIQELLAAEGMPSGVITTVYTDNQFLADLPLLAQATGNGYVVGPSSALYRYLPVGMGERLRFYPMWGA